MSASLCRAWHLGVGLSALLAYSSAMGGTTHSDETAYVGGYVLAPSGDSYVAKATILVKGTKIESIEPPGAAIPSSARIVRLDGRYVIPGLINAHVHLATAAAPRLARAYLRRELDSGVTMVRDMAGDVRLLAELKREALQDEIPAPDIFYAALFAGAPFFDDPRTQSASRGIEPGKAPWMQAVDAETDLRLAVAEAKGTGATAIKLYADMPASLLMAITTEAHRQHMLVWAHAAVFPARPSDVVAAGVDVMSHADFIAFESRDPFPENFVEAKHTDQSGWHMTPAEESVLNDMQRRSVILDATLDVGFRYPFKNWPARIAPEVAREAYRLGVAIAAGTDDDIDDMKGNDSALLTEIERLVRDAGMTAADALRSATIVGARVVGQQDSAGVLAPGREADFVVLKSDPLRDIRHLHGVALVVKHGIVYAPPRPQVGAMRRQNSSNSTVSKNATALTTTAARIRKYQV